MWLAIVRKESQKLLDFMPLIICNYMGHFVTKRSSLLFMRGRVAEFFCDTKSASDALKRYSEY